MRLVPVLVVLAHAAVVSSALGQSAQTPRLDSDGDSLPDGAVVRLGTVRFQTADHTARVVFADRPEIALSPDGAAVAKAVQGNGATHIEFMDTATGKTLRRMKLTDVDASRVQFTPDGKQLVASGRFGGITLLDAMTGRVIRSFELRTGFGGGAVAVSADGRWLATQAQESAYDVPVRRWNMTTGKELATLPGRGASCGGLAFGPSGKRLLLRSIVPSHADGNSIGFDSNCKAVVACIDTTTRKIVGEATVATSQEVALSPDGETVAVEDIDHKSVRVRHLPTGAERCVITVKQPKMAFAPGGQVLLTLDQDGWATLWDATKGSKIRDLDGAMSNTDFDIVGIAKDGKTIAVRDGGWESAATVVVWNAATGKRAGRPPGHQAAVTCLAYALGGKLLASGSLDRTVRLWNPDSSAHIRELAAHADVVTAVVFSPDGKLLASSSKNGVTRLIRVADGEVVASFTGPDKGATRLTFSPDGKVLFAGGNSPEVVAWQVASAKELLRFPTGPDGAVMALADGGALALTANGELRAENTPERLQVWNSRTKLSVVSMPIGTNDRGAAHCGAAAFSLDGRLVASSQVSEYQGLRPSYGAAMLRLWERASGQPIRMLNPTITSLLAFSPNGRLLASGGAGRSGHLSEGYGNGVDIWDIVTGKKVGAVPVTPHCVMFSPDGRRLATGGRDHCVLIWEAPSIPAHANTKAPSDTQRHSWWKALGGSAKDAHEAMAQLLNCPEHAVALLKEHIQPVRPSDPATVAKLIRQLDSDSYTDRANAQAALEKMGEGAAHLLKLAMQDRHPVEVRRRLETLLRRCDATSAAVLRHQRAVATLEWLGTPAARALLRTLAGGAPGAHLTADARSALKRLEG